MAEDDPATTRQALEGKLAGAGVSEGARSAAVEWFMTNGAREPAAEAPKHPYSLDDLDLDDGARPHLNSFLNHMAGAEASQEDIAAALKVHRQMRGTVALEQARQAKEVDGMDREDAQNAENQMRSVWGTEHWANLRLIDQYLRSLPAEERSKIEEERNEEGVLALNDPKRLSELAELARRGPTSAKTEAQEFAELSAMVKNHGAPPYYRGPDSERLRARYRDLLQRGFQP